MSRVGLKTTSDRENDKVPTTCPDKPLAYSLLIPKHNIVCTLMEILNFIAAFFVTLGLLSALVIAMDLPGRRQSMKIMNSVWVLTGLWAGIAGLWAYFAFGRGKTGKPGPPADGMDGMKHGTGNSGMASDMKSMEDMKNMPEMKNMPGMPGMKRPGWQSVTLSTLHCGAGCTLADLIGEWFLFFVPLSVGGSLLFGSWVLDYVLALCIGVYFQYAAIRSMQRIPKQKAVLQAIKADFLSLTAWQAGMYGWMALVVFGFLHGNALPKTSWMFWFMMQIAMCFGFAVAWPVNILLIRSGIKKGM